MSIVDILKAIAVWPLAAVGEIAAGTGVVQKYVPTAAALATPWVVFGGIPDDFPTGVQAYLLSGVVFVAVNYVIAMKSKAANSEMNF